MKKTKFFSMLTALLCVLTMSMTFSACGDDDDDPIKPTPGVTDTNIKKIDFTYKLELSQTYLDIADVTITYLDENGNEQTEAITSTKWTKTVSRNGVPASFYAKPSFTLKEGVDATHKYDFSSNYGYDYNTLNAKGEVVTSNKKGDEKSTKGAQGDKLERFLQVAAKDNTIKCNINAKGLPESE